jgi:hypothetical protein
LDSSKAILSEVSYEEMVTRDPSWIDPDDARGV